MLLSIISINDSMNVLIKGLWETRKYYPERKTYVIRIFASGTNWLTSHIPLRKSDNYETVMKYVFDDITPETIGRRGKFGFDDKLLFTKEMGLEIIADFIAGKESCEDLLVHCHRGRSRAPAVAIALNDSFGLGQDGEEMKRQNPRYNKFVYEMIMKSARSIGLVR